MRTLTTLALTLVLMGLHLTLNAQDKKWQIGPRVGAMTYQGDLLEDRFGAASTGPLASLFLSRLLSDKLNAEVAVAFGAFLGDDEDSGRRRAISSMSYTYSTSFSVQYSLFKQQVKAGQNWGITPFVTAGVGFIYSDLHRTNLSKTSPDFLVKSNNALCAPLGGGLRLFNSDNTVISMDFRFNLTNTDLLEGVSASGNSKNKDTFTTLTMSIGRKF